MSDYVINLLGDTSHGHRHSDAVLLCRIEQGEIGGWKEVENQIELGVFMHKGIQAIGVTVLSLKRKICGCPRCLLWRFGLHGVPLSGGY